MSNLRNVLLAAAACLISGTAYSAPISIVPFNSVENGFTEAAVATGAAATMEAATGAAATMEAATIPMPVPLARIPVPIADDASGAVACVARPVTMHWVVAAIQTISAAIQGGRKRDTTSSPQIPGDTP
jgi:hypothetical protein